MLSAHVVVGIVFVGPVAVVTSLFPRYAPVSIPSVRESGERSTDVARVLHRVTRVYGTLALAVPVTGLTLALVQGRTTDTWVIAAMALTAVAGGLLAFQIAPLQREALTSPDTGARLRRIGMSTGVFNLVWVVVVVLMVVRPGETA